MKVIDSAVQQLISSDFLSISLHTGAIADGYLFKNKRFKDITTLVLACIPFFSKQKGTSNRLLKFCKEILRQ